GWSAQRGRLLRPPPGLAGPHRAGRVHEGGAPPAAAGGGRPRAAAGRAVKLPAGRRDAEVDRQRAALKGVVAMRWLLPSPRQPLVLSPDFLLSTMSLRVRSTIFRKSRA